MSAASANYYFLPEVLLTLAVFATVLACADPAGLFGLGSPPRPMLIAAAGVALLATHGVKR